MGQLSRRLVSVTVFVRLVSMEVVAIHFFLVQLSLFCHPGRCWQLEGEIQTLTPMKLGLVVH